MSAISISFRTLAKNHAVEILKYFLTILLTPALSSPTGKYAVETGAKDSHIVGLLLQQHENDTCRLNEHWSGTITSAEQRPRTTSRWCLAFEL